MANRSGREALQGAEVQTLDLIAEVLTSAQWAELLKGPLERAAGQGNRGLAQKLVRAGAEMGDTLHEAVRGGHRKLAVDLLENGASIEAKHTRYGFTPLHVAAAAGQPKMVELLMLKGADTNATDNEGWTPLSGAAESGQMASALALLTGGADVNHRCGENKMSVVHIAAKNWHWDILTAAIEHGADVDAADGLIITALHDAATFNEAAAIDVLVKAGANIQAQDDGGWTPLHCACRNLGLEAVTALLKHGALVNAQDGSLLTPLHCAAGHAGEGAAEVVDLLLRWEADETIVNDEGETAADVVGEYVEEENPSAEDVKRVRNLLAKAPADRAWRRRGYLLLCRAYPDKLQLKQEVDGACSATALRRAGAKLPRTDGRSCVGNGTDWVVVAAKALGLQEEGIFRTIVAYL